MLIVIARGGGEVYRVIGVFLHHFRHPPFLLFYPSTHNRAKGTQILASEELNFFF